MLKNVYGEVVIKKDSILYHTSDEIFSYMSKNKKPMLFCTFHPSEWDGMNDYVTPILIKKDISLFFMIDGFRKTQIFSALNSLVNHPSKNLSKQNDNNLKYFSEELKKEKFDGWFSSIENKNTVEVALLNNTNNFIGLETIKLRRNWRNGNNLNGEISTKNWGKKYPICTRKIPVIFNINDRFKSLIEEYIRFGKMSDFPNEYIFQVILTNAKINYHYFPFQDIKWNLPL